VGHPVFDIVTSAEELIGPIADGVSAPDVIGVAREHFEVAPGSVFDDIVAPSPRPDRGVHAPDGMLILASPLQRRSVTPPGVEDVAPTMLAALGFDPPEWMTGRALLASDASRSLKEPSSPESPTRELTAEDEAVIERHLQGLGYVE
jgi:hypothetical protein